MSSGVASQALQAALYALLSADNNLTSTLGYGVYDEPDDDAAFPYVLIGPINEKPNNRMGGKVARELLVTFVLWSEYKGAKQIQQGFSRIDQLLDNNKTLVVTGYTLESLDFDSSDIFREAGILRRGETRYKVRLCE